MSKPQTRSESSQDDNTQETPLSLQEQLAEHLARVQHEYRQLQSWLRDTAVQLSRREAEITRHLSSALSLIGSPRPLAEARAAQQGGAPGVMQLYVRSLGKFEVRYENQTISLGSNKNGRAILRYLVTVAERCADKDVLQALFWPNDPPDKASHKLHIAISTVRQALDEALQMPADGESILFVEDCYLLSPDLYVQLDADVFAAHVQAGQALEREGRAVEAAVEYEAARALYGGDFLVEDLYADWTAVQRARLQEMYLTLLGRLARHHMDQEQYAESVSCCRQILVRDSFREDATRHLMRCYSRMGRRNQALREFKACQEVLQRELGVSPMRETMALYEQIAREEEV